MNKLLRCLLVLGIIFQSTVAFATRYFVNSTSGNNGNTLAEARLASTPWQTISFAVGNAGVVNGDTIEIASGTYPEFVYVRKGLHLRGSLGTGIKPIITGIGTDSNYVIRVQAPNVTINNLQIEVNQTTRVYGILANVINTFNNLQIVNSSILSTGTGTGRGCSVFNSFGVFVGGSAFNTDRVIIKRSTIGPKNPDLNCVFGRGIRAIGTNINVGGTGADSCSITGVFALQLGNQNGGPCIVENNSLNGIGVEINNPIYVPTGFSDQHRISNNRFGTFLTPTTETQLEIKENQAPFPAIRIEGNTFNGFNQFGIFSSRSANVSVRNNIFIPAENATNYTCVGVNTKQKTSNATQVPFTNNITLTGNTFNGNFFGRGTGIEFFDHNSGVTNPFAGTVIGGSGTLANKFDSKLTRFIKLDDNQGNSNLYSEGTWNTSPVTQMAPVAQDFDISANLFDLGNGYQAPSALTLAQLYRFEDKVVHKTDYAALGHVFVVANQAFITDSSFLSPRTTTPSLTRAMLKLTDGGTVNFETGNLGTENATVSNSLTFNGSVTVSLNGLTMNGSGKTLAQLVPFQLNSLALTAGVIESRARISVANAANITGGSSSSYLRTIANSLLSVGGINATTRLIPIGSTNGYAPLNVSDANNSADVFSFRVAATNTISQFTPNLGFNIITFVNQNWFINEATPGGSNLQVRINWNSNNQQNGSLVAPVFAGFANSSASTYTENPVTLTGNFANLNITESGSIAVYTTTRPVATRYYVNNLTGLDTRLNIEATNPNTPWLTIANALSRVSDFDTIEVASTGTTYVGKLTIGKKVYLEGRSNGSGVKPVITTTTNTDEEVIFVNDSNITIDNFRITVNQANTLYGIRASTLYHELRVEDCEILSLVRSAMCSILMEF